MIGSLVRLLGLDGVPPPADAARFTPRLEALDGRELLSAGLTGALGFTHDGTGEAEQVCVQTTGEELPSAAGKATPILFHKATPVVLHIGEEIPQ